MRIPRPIIAAGAALAVAVPLASAAVITGGDTADVLRGTRVPDTVTAKAGDDTVLGFLGPDSVLGQAGDDLLMGGRGNDDLLGGEGADVLVGGPGRDELLGQAGDDVLMGGFRADVLSGGSGDDRLLGAQGFDTLYAGPGEDLLMGGRGNDVLFARFKDGQKDVLICGPGVDRAVARPEDEVDASCERVRRLPDADTSTDPADEDTPPAAATRGDDRVAQADDPDAE